MLDISDFQVGDEFVLSPHELGRVISAVLAEGGSFDLDGGSVTITSLPNRRPVKKETVTEVKTVEPKKEEVKTVEPKQEEVKKEAALEAVKPAPKPTGRPRKVVPYSPTP